MKAACRHSICDLTGKTKIGMNLNIQLSVNFAMKNRSLVAASLFTIFLFNSGCENTGPRTQEGAVNGAALGALGGAIVGNNSRGGNGGGGAIVGAIAGALIGGAIGNEADQRERSVYTSEREATTTVIMAEPPQPPAKPSEVIPRRPTNEAVWVSGYWIYNSNGRYEWEPGRWEIPPPRCNAFVPPHWARQGNGYVYTQGYWKL